MYFNHSLKPEILVLSPVFGLETKTETGDRFKKNRFQERARDPIKISHKTETKKVGPKILFRVFCNKETDFWVPNFVFHSLKFRRYLRTAVARL
jgi:hypothetical protein